MRSTRRRQWLALMGVVVFSACLFLLSYFFDNKYVDKGPQAMNGVLLLDEEALRSHPVVHLVDGWEIYRDRLLEPKDFATGVFLAKEDVFIGQYGGFEGKDPSRSPHGSATYRMIIALPSQEQSYMLELPEIYSAYRLYANGVLLEQFGEPDRQAYAAQTGNSSVTFRAKESLELIFAVSDYTHRYSGMVYPPAFGTPRAVSAQLNARFALRAAACAVALAAGMLYLAIGIFTKKNRAAALYGFLCFCFVGYTCYPVVRTLWRGGMLGYGVESLCFNAMLLIVTALQRGTGVGRRWAKAFLLYGMLMCLCSLALLLLPSDHLFALNAYSGLIGIYKWASAAYLTANLVVAAYRGERRSAVMLGGVLVFACALIADRLLPDYEPIRFGWFIEMAGAALVIATGIVMGQDVVRQYRDKLVLEERMDGVLRFVKMQRSYYPVVLKGVEEARAARHDLRHHLRVIQDFVSNRRYEELEGYLEEYSGGIRRAVPLAYCDHYVLDVILGHFAVLAHQEGIDWKAEVSIPKELGIEDVDLCIIISNLLENALEACRRIEAKGFIYISIKQIGHNLIVLVDNSFDGAAFQRKGRPPSSKQIGRTGIGLDSIAMIAEKYRGGAAFTPDEAARVFRSEVLIFSSIAEDDPSRIADGE